MADLYDWTGPLRASPFRFRPQHRPSFAVTLRRIIIARGADGPVETGDVFTSHYRDGRRVSEHREAAP